MSATQSRSSFDSVRRKIDSDECELRIGICVGGPATPLFWAFFNSLLVLLCHIFLGRDCLAMGAAQHGHRGSVLTRAATMRRRMVAIEFGMWRSGRNGGSSGSMTVGYGKFRERPGGTSC